MKNLTETLLSEINDTTTEALAQVINSVVDYLQENLQENDSDDCQNSQTTLTIQPKIKITLNAPSAFSVQVTIPVKRIEKVTGEAKTNFDLNQPDFFKEETEE